MTIQHLLWDADGVLQISRGGWVEALRPVAGDRAEALLASLFEAEQPALRGEEDVLVAVAACLDDYDLDVDPLVFYETVWLTIDLVPETIALLHRGREAGYGIHLGSNQTRRRAEHMRAQLGFDELFDVSLYSHALGVTKHDPDYFVQAAAQIGVDPATILFVDDVEPNVQAARRAGLAAEHWIVDQERADRDVPRLLSLLARHGVDLS